MPNPQPQVADDAGRNILIDLLIIASGLAWIVGIVVLVDDDYNNLPLGRVILTVAASVTIITAMVGAAAVIVRTQRRDLARAVALMQERHDAAAADRASVAEVLGQLASEVEQCNARIAQLAAYMPGAIDEAVTHARWEGWGKAAEDLAEADELNTRRIHTLRRNGDGR